MFNYVETNEFGKILSYGSSTSRDLSFKRTKGVIHEISSGELKLLEGCEGDIQDGISKLKKLKNKLSDYFKDFEDYDN